MSLSGAQPDFAKLFVAIDSMDTESFLGFLAEDCTFRFGSAPPAVGHDAIRATVDQFFTLFAALHHDIHRIVAGDTAIACEGEVTYTHHDGNAVTVPFCNIFETAGGRIAVYRIYIDMSPVFGNPQ